MGHDLTLTKISLFISTTLKTTWIWLLSSLHLYPLVSCSASLSIPPLLFSSPFYTLIQVPGQLHGWRQRRLHEGKSPQRHADHHPTEKVYGTHQDHLSSSQEAQVGLPSSDGGRRRPGEQTGGGWTGWGSVLGVGLHFLSLNMSDLSTADYRISYFLFIYLFLEKPNISFIWLVTSPFVAIWLCFFQCVCVHTLHSE